MALLLTVAAGLGVGLFWPQQDSAETAAPTGLEIALNRSSDGHFYVDGLVDEKPVRFLIDTGSSAIALSAKDAQRVGITSDDARNEYIGEGASGIVRGRYTKVKGVDIGGIRYSGAEVAIVEGLNVSLLGQPFLERLDEIVIRKDQMLLRSGPAASQSN